MTTLKIDFNSREQLLAFANWLYLDGEILFAATIKKEKQFKGFLYKGYDSSAPFVEDNIIRIKK